MSDAAVAGLAERARGPLDLNAGDSLTVLLGPGTTDVVVGPDYQQRPFDESLWNALRAAGMRRIVFSSGSDPVYALDDDSFALLRSLRGDGAALTGGRTPGRAARHLPRRGKQQNDGPVTAAWQPAGRPHGPGEAADSLADAAQEHAGVPSSRARSAAGDGGGSRSLSPEDVRVLSACLRTGDQPTAVAVLRAEQFLSFIAAKHDLMALVADWLQPSTASDNLCILIFSSRSLDTVLGMARSLGLTTLVSYLERQASRRAARSVTEIGEPGLPEIGRIVQVARLRYGLRLADWREHDRIVAALAAQRGVLASEWIRRLRGLARAGVPLSIAELRERGWVEALPSGQSAWDRLNELTGLAEVKEHLDRLRWRAEVEAKRRRAGLPHEPDSLHLVFTGRPGTGKTTVARLVGELYRELGLLRRGHVHAPEAAELIGMYVGHTAVLTNRAVDAALDGVLFIDEAYRLSEQPGGFGQEAIDSLVTRMDNDRDRLTVIVAGYPDKMEGFLRSNPGLPRRFPRGNIVQFPDYQPGELESILLKMLSARGLSWVPELEKVLARVIAGLFGARDESFGNAGEMRNLAQELETNWARRVRADIAEPLTPEDLPAAYRKWA